MEQIELLKDKYRQAISDNTHPYKYIPENIKELSADIKKIEKIISENEDSDVLKACGDLKSKLHKSLKFFQNKLEHIPNKHYLDESDEDWVDENMPILKVS